MARRGNTEPDEAKEVSCHTMEHAAISETAMAAQRELLAIS